MLVFLLRAAFQWDGGVIVGFAMGGIRLKVDVVSGAGWSSITARVRICAVHVDQGPRSGVILTHFRILAPQYHLFTRQASYYLKTF